MQQQATEVTPPSPRVDAYAGGRSEGTERASARRRAQVEERIRGGRVDAEGAARTATLAAQRAANAAEQAARAKAAGATAVAEARTAIAALREQVKALEAEVVQTKAAADTALETANRTRAEATTDVRLDGKARTALWELGVADAFAEDAVKRLELGKKLLARTEAQVAEVERNLKRLPAPKEQPAPEAIAEDGPKRVLVDDEEDVVVEVA